MKRKWTISIISGLALVLILAACQAQATPNSNQNGFTFQGTRQFNGTFPAGAGRGFRETAQAEGTTVFQFNGTAFPGGFQGNGSPQGNVPAGGRPQGTPSPQVTATATPEPTATATIETATTQAEATVKAYFNALANGSFSQAASFVSIYSLAVDQMSGSDVQTALAQEAAAGGAWSDLQIVDSQSIAADTVLVHVKYQYGTGATKTDRDELWPVRNEAGNWLYNWNNLIDYKTLSNDPLTSNGVTLDPQILYRYSDHMVLKLMAQNGTNNLIVFGQSNEIIGNFHFGSQKVASEENKIVLNPLRTYLDATIIVDGYFENYPDSIDIRTWTNYDSPPWFTFVFSY